MLIPDELQNVVPVMSATTIPAPSAMAKLSSPPIGAALVTSISAGKVTTTGRAQGRVGGLEPPISSSPPLLWRGQLPRWPGVMRGQGDMSGKRGICPVRDPAGGREGSRRRRQVMNLRGHDSTT